MAHRSELSIEDFAALPPIEVTSGARTTIIIDDMLAERGLLGDRGKHCRWHSLYPC